MFRRLSQPNTRLSVPFLYFTYAKELILTLILGEGHHTLSF